MSHTPYHDAETDAELIASLRRANDDMATQFRELRRCGMEHVLRATLWRAVARDLMRKSGAPEAEIEERLRLAYAGVAG